MALMTFPSDFKSLYLFGNRGFDVSDLQSALFHPLDIERFELNHPEIFSKVPFDKSPEQLADLEEKLAEAQKGNASLREWNKKLNDSNGRVNKTNVEMKQQVAELEAQLAQARQENERLKADAQATAAPRTSKASEVAQASRVEEWKGYATTMAKAAYQCGLEDRKGMTRTEYERLAKKLGELSPTALELLREALPEVTKTTPGVSRQG